MQLRGGVQRPLHVRVNTPAARPNSVAFPGAMASSRSSNGMTDRTGAKTSSRITRMSGRTSVSTVGARTAPSRPARQQLRALRHGIPDPGLGRSASARTLIIGPTSVSGRRGSPTTRPETSFRKRGRKSSRTLRSTNSRWVEVQAWPCRRKPTGRSARRPDRGPRQRTQWWRRCCPAPARPGAGRAPRGWSGRPGSTP